MAENEKILNDKIKLKKILSKKMTTDKEKSWLRLKLREYKVKKSDFIELSKMDIIPVSIALARAAKKVGTLGLLLKEMQFLVNGHGPDKA